MSSEINTPKNTETLIPYNNILIACLLSIAFMSCQKQSILPQEAQGIQSVRSDTNNIASQLHISSSTVQLLQSNANRIAISADWTLFACNSTEIKDYQIEATMAGSKFVDWVEIGSSDKPFVQFTTEEFNRQIRKLFVTGFEEDIILRVKANRFNSTPLYSNGMPLEVTTYQPVIGYDDSHVFRIPGNFQDWKPELAQKIISPTANGEYEGYINFTEDCSQFLMLKNSSSWNTSNTYYYIGANKFGFGGTMFSIKDGAGIYKFNASLDTHTWSCTKINSWSVIGTAITEDGNTDVEMVRNSNNISWQITGNFTAGNFVFRANKSNDIVFGHNGGSEIGIPDYNGSKIEITKAGNYYIELSLSSAGNYSYSIRRS